VHSQDNLLADIVIGGWLDPDYFSLGLGSATSLP
jgi:hypothetical protein